MSPTQAAGSAGILPARAASNESAETVATGRAACVTLEDLLAFRETVFLVCLGFTRRRAEAEDMTQETYLRALATLEQLRDPLASKAWLCRIARNTCLDLLRRQRWQNLFSIVPERPDSQPNPEELFESQEQVRALKRAVSELPSRLRDVFVLRTYGELSYEEVARSLGVRLGTVMSRLHRARAFLTNKLERQA